MLKTLEVFQDFGAGKLAANAHHMLADVPGLGKTVQAIEAAERLKLKRILVVCPASVRSGWKQEITECLGEFNPDRWDIISYNEAVREAENINGYDCDAIIMDEAHFLKTPASQRTQAIFGNVAGLARRAWFKWPLTGTPVLNRPRELYPILRTLHPAFAKMDFAAFAQRYCGAFWDGYGLNTRGASHINELAGLLAPFMTRRTKAEVFPDRKEPQIQLVPIDVSRFDLAPVHAEEELILNREAYLSPTHEKFAQLGDLSRLLRVTGVAKIPAGFAYMSDLLETIPKLVVFYHHTEVGRGLFERFENIGCQPVIYRGGMSDGQKDEQKQKFMEKAECRVFLGQIQAAGTGINGLQSVCSDVVFAEQEWVPGAMGQAIDRLDRIGQQADYVTARILHAPGTLESALLGSRTYKTAIISRLMGKGETKNG